MGKEKRLFGADARRWLGRLLLYCACSVYLELWLHLFIYHSVDSHIVYPVLFGLMAGVGTAVLTSLLPRVPQRIAAILLILVQCLLAEIQLIYQAVFGGLMPLSQLALGGGVINDFLDQTLYAIGQNVWKVLILLLPLIAVIIVMLRKGLSRRIRPKQALFGLLLLLALGAGTVVLMREACSHPISVWRIFRDPGTSTELSYRHVGMTGTTLQELYTMVFGEGARGGSSLDGSGELREYDPAAWNVMPELDFTALAESAEDPALAALDRYFAAKEPTPKNEFTGRLKGYNVIVLCAESYSPMFVTPERTPTLYKMSHSGIVFHNFYTTFTYMTTNGEYTTLLGLLPDMTRAKSQSSFSASVGHYLPFCFATALKNEGYLTLAYHSNNGEFYNRSQTHPNMGYDFRAIGSGLVMPKAKPASDLEMMKASVDDYLNSDDPFHVYYMTYSGHYHYTWGNAMSAKNRDKVEDLPYSDKVKAYIACNLELEAAMSYLEQRLQEAGKLDKTLIVLTTDHYPYGLSEENYNELAGREIDVDFEKYHNSFICYAPGLGETYETDVYCSTADILPTVLNLLGVEYDSRLLAGTDALAEGRHAAVLYTGSFITDGFRFNAETGELIPDPGTQADQQTLEAYRTWVEEKFTCSREILNTNYYAHAFPNAQFSFEGETEIPFDDFTTLREQGNALFLYRKGLIDLYGEREFGFRQPSTMCDYLSCVYRQLGSPTVTEEALPEGFAEAHAGGVEAFRAGAGYQAVCWAFREGLLRAEDRFLDVNAPMHNAELCLLHYRTIRLVNKKDYPVEEADIEAFDFRDDLLTHDEREAVVWCVGSSYLPSDSEQYLFDDTEENIVNRYAMCKFFLRLFYPELQR